MSRYTAALRNLGAADQDHAAIARRAAAITGGIADAPARPVCRLTGRLKALDHQMDSALGVAAPPDVCGARHERRRYLHDFLGGLPQLDQSEEVAAAFDHHADALIGWIQSVRDFLLNRERLAVSFTGSDPRLRPRPLDRVDAATPVVPAPTGFEPLSPARPGLAEPVQVAHCAKVIPAPQASDPVEAPLSVGAT